MVPATRESHASSLHPGTSGRSSQPHRVLRDRHSTPRSLGLPVSETSPAVWTHELTGKPRTQTLNPEPARQRLKCRETRGSAACSLSGPPTANCRLPDTECGG